MMLKVLKWVALLLIFLFSYTFANFYLGMKQVEKEWLATNPPQIKNIGSTSSLSITPLVNWHTQNKSLKTEAGVSYLIKTDKNTILFDVGFNMNGETPSPLEHNMAELGVELNDIDTVFISHAHLDHNGGQKWVNNKTFSLGTEQVDLSGKNIFAPTEMTYPNNDVAIIQDPTFLAQGVASLGSIPRQLFMGRIEEQALVINVEGKGLVVIVGCGHQTLPKIVSRLNQTLSQPLYGVIGDLHYPVPDGRINLFGLNLQKLLSSGEGPISPISKQTIEKEIELLQQVGVEVVGLGGHDTSDTVIARFHQIFGEGYHHIRVGEEITLPTTQHIK